MSKITASPHDKMFRAALKNIKVARAYFEQYLPKSVLKTINLDILDRCPEIHVNQYLERSESDVVYRTNIAGEAAYLYLSAEHQSKDDEFMPFRVLKYNIGIWQFHRDQNPGSKKLPLIINTVFYNGKRPYRHSTDFKDLLNAPRELVDEFWARPFMLIQAWDRTDDELLEQKWAGLFQFFMKHIHSLDLLPHLETVLPLLKTIDAENGVEYIEAVCNYALTAGEVSNTEKFVTIISNELSRATGEKIMTGAEQLMQIGVQKGIQQGIQQGIEQGTLEGERTILKRLLTRRFGFISLRYLEKIQNADSGTLLLWSEKILDAGKVEDVFNSYH